MTRLDKIHEYLISLGNEIDEILYKEKTPFYLAYEIALYAHRNQKRENGLVYVVHPLNCLENFHNLIGYDLDNPLTIDGKLLDKYNIPFKGVSEVCLLHDVIEDTNFTINDIEKLFKECNYEEYFNQYIKDALIKITHIESIPYEKYIDICMENPISALVKMMDLIDNSNALSLISFDNYSLNKHFIDVQIYVHLFIYNIVDPKEEIT